jgi:hypothetical protein
MKKTTYRILLRKKGQTCDVEMTEAGAKPRIVNTFNSEAEAWEWVNEQETVNKSAVRESEGRKNKP